MHAELQAALEQVRQQRQGSRTATAAGIAVTGTGFYGEDRAGIRVLAHLGGITYSGDLIHGTTTHLVLAPGGIAAAGAGELTRKVAKAAEWGIPCLRFAWLPDSILAGRLQPTEPYLVPSQPHPQQQPGAWQGRQLQEQHAAAANGAAQQRASCWQLPRHPRPSSVASNAPAAAGGTDTRQQAAGCHRSEEEPVLEPAPQECRQHPAPHAALAAVDNLLSDQLRRMSISPEPPAAAQSPASTAALLPLVPRWPDDSPPQQRSPSHSPQRSLSMQGMVGPAGQPAATAACSPGDVTSGGQEAEPPAGFSPMLHSPPDEQHRGAAGQPQGEASADPACAAQPFSFSLAGALGRSPSDGAMGGSPMADSPAGAGPVPESLSSGGDGSAASAPSSRLAGTPADGGSQEPECTLPTPACIGDWSDDGSDYIGSPAAAGEPQASIFYVANVTTISQALPACRSTSHAHQPLTHPAFFPSRTMSCACQLRLLACLQVASRARMGPARRRLPFAACWREG